MASTLRLSLPTQSQSAWTAAGLLLVLLVGAIDRFTPAPMVFAIFYLIPVVAVAWFVGRPAGVLIAGASAIAWLIVNRAQAAPGSPAFIPYWNALSGFVVFVAVVLLLSAVKTLNERLEDRVERRTAELKTEIEEHKRTEERLRASEQRFRQLADAINEVFWMTDSAQTQVIYISPAYEQVWGRTCASLYAAPHARLEAVHPEDRDRVLQAASPDQIRTGYDQEYRITRPGGAVRWIHDRAFPIVDAAGAFYRVAGIATDITEQKRLEKEVLEVSDQEQRRIGRDLHDGLCQHLTATMFASRILQDELARDGAPHAAQAGQIADFIDQAIRQARDVARGLDPVKVATNGLMSALEELAATVRNLHRLGCIFRADAPVLIEDDAVAIHLYRIAQEAVNNAVKHAHPTQLEIRLASQNNRILLTIQDNGTGFVTPPGKRDGMGLQTMNYRARMIGASLEVRRDPKGGTIVSCAFQQNPAVNPNPQPAEPAA